PGRTGAHCGASQTVVSADTAAAPALCFVQVETVATTLALAEQNNARELKRVCLEFVSKQLSSVMGSEGYQYMISTCPQLQAELLTVIANAPPQPAGGGGQRSSRPVHLGGGGGGVHHGAPAPAHRGDESSTDAQLRR